MKQSAPPRKPAKRSRARARLSVHTVHLVHPVHDVHFEIWRLHVRRRRVPPVLRLLVEVPERRDPVTALYHPIETRSVKLWKPRSSKLMYR
jgi:hypothetical protein